MHIKRFEAPTLIEAIRKVKAELGPDALVLSERRVRRDRGFFGVGGRSLVEVTAATDRDVLRDTPRGEERVAPDASWGDLRLTRALMHPVEAELRTLRERVESIAASIPERECLLRDLEEIRRAARDLRREAARGACDAREAPLVGALLEAGLAPRHAFALGREAGQRRTRPGDDPRVALHDTLVAHLDGRMLPPSDEKLRADLFVGPTGVGKTTTLAKLAARRGKRARRRSLSVVTTDVLRCGGEAQLRGYSESIGVPFHVACSPSDLEGILQREPSRRLLVDTAGRSPVDPHSLLELQRCREALGPRTCVQLVLAATTKEEDLRRAVERFRCLAPDGIVLTKLDESASLANVVNLLFDADVPRLFWVADGQRVPEDLRVPDPSAIAARLLGAAA